MEDKDTSQKNAEVEDRSEKWLTKMPEKFKCFNCDEEGHMAWNCRKPRKGQQWHINIEHENEDLKEFLTKMKDTMDILTAWVENLKEEELWDKTGHSKLRGLRRLRIWTDPLEMFLYQLLGNHTNSSNDLKPL
jgi:Zinc knuckle